MLSSGELIGDVERDQDRGGDHRVFEHDVVEPVLRERRIGLGHRAPAFAASGFSMVVFASHSSPTGTELRCCGTKPRCRKNSCALSLTSAVNRRAPREPASFSSASISMVPTPWPAAAGCTYSMSTRSPPSSDAKPTGDP